MQTDDEPHVRDDPKSPLFAAWARFIVRGRWLILAVTAAIAAVSVWLIDTRAVIDTSVEAFAANDSEPQRVLEEYRNEFGRDEMFLLLIEGDVFSQPFLEKLRALHTEVSRLDMPLSTLGERRADRDRKRGKKPIFDAAPPAAPPSDGGAKSGEGQAGAGSAPAGPPAKPADDFGSFGSGDDWGAGGAGDGFGDLAADATWGDEAGGTVIEQATSIINVRRTRSRADGIEVGELMKPWPFVDGDPAGNAERLAAIRAEVLGDKTLVGQVVGKEGHHAVIALRTAFMSEEDSALVYERLVDIAKHHSTDGFGVAVSGLPALNAGLQVLLLNDLERLLALSVVLMLVILMFIFRHPLGVLAPMAVVGLAAASTVGMMGLAGMPLTLLSNILPAFLFCVGIGDSVHLISVYRDAMKEGMTSHQAVEHAVATTGMPIFYTSLTTVVGLLSFRFASLDAIGEMGTAGAFGVGIAFLYSVTLLPALLSFNKGSLMGARPPGENDFIDRFLQGCLNLSGLPDDPGTGPEPPLARKRRIRTLAVVALLFALGFWGASTLRLWHNPLSWLPDDEPMKMAFDSMDANVGGTANVQLLIDGTPEHGIKDHALLHGLEELEAHIRAYRDPDIGPIVGNAISVLDVVRETNRALHGGDPSEYKLPPTDRGVADMLFMFENAGPNELRQLASTDLRRAQMTLRIKWLEASTLKPLTEHIEVGIQEHIPKNARVRATGSAFTLVSTVGNLLRDLIASFGTAFAVITLIMMLLLRGLRLGALAMVPNLMPIVMIMGFMGFVGIPIDLNNLLIASISIGVAVDDTIHFLHHWRVNMQRTNNVEVSLRRAMRHSGRAMVSTSVVLVLGFAVYTGAEMANIQRFGLLTGLTSLMALLIDLIVGPVLLRTFYRRAKAVEEPSDAPA